jgi:hypothetical protein
MQRHSEVDELAPRPVPMAEHPAIREAIRAGIDIYMLEDALAMTVKERWDQHRAALAFAQKLGFGNRLHG